MNEMTTWARKTTFGYLPRLQPFYLFEKPERRLIKIAANKAINIKTRKTIWLDDAVKIWKPTMKPKDKMPK